MTKKELSEVRRSWLFNCSTDDRKTSCVSRLFLAAYSYKTFYPSISATEVTHTNVIPSLSCMHTRA